MQNIDFSEIQDNLDFKLAESKNLIIDNDYTNYSKIYFTYKYGLEYLLKKMTLIEQYDNKISTSDLGFLEVLSEEKDFYQYYSSLKYFYLRNNLYIERLSTENLDKLNKINIDDLNDINVLIQIVLDTYKDIIIEYPDIDRDTIISFGFDDINKMPNNGSLVIGFRYDEYRNEKDLGDKWQNNYIKQVEMIEQLLPKLEKSFEDILKNKVKFIQYDEFSVKKKLNKAK